jgi:hypothetical protein
MVQACCGLGEELAATVVVSVKGEHERHVRIGEDFPDATRVGDVHQEVNVEDCLVPPHGGIQIGDGEREVV